MTEYSNAVVVNGALVMLPNNLLAAGITASNYLADGEPRFKARGYYTKPMTHFVLHETAGDSNTGPKAKFLRGPFSAQLIASDMRHVSCHADLGTDILWHGNQLNKCGPGIEFVNPYNPLYDRPPMRETIPRKWWTWLPSIKTDQVADAVKRKGWTSVPSVYCLPTESQIVVLKLFVPWICGVLDIPYVFPTANLNARKRKIDGWNAHPAKRPQPGVVAHRDFAGHADGRYLLDILIEQERCTIAHTCAPERQGKDESSI